MSERPYLDNCASAIHELWIIWARIMLDNEKRINPNRTEKAGWESYMIPFDELPENMKEENRKIAKALTGVFLMKPMQDLRRYILINMPATGDLKMRFDGWSKGYVEGIEKSSFIIRRVFDVYGIKEPELEKKSNIITLF